MRKSPRSSSPAAVAPLAALLTALLAAADGADAQSVHRDLAPQAVPEGAVERVRTPAPDSPYRPTRPRDGVLLAGAAAAVLLAEALSDPAPTLTPEDLAGVARDDVNRFDRPATRRYSPARMRLSRRLLAPLALTPLALLADEHVRSDWTSLGVMYAQTTLIAAAAPGIAKATIPRHRPFVYNTDLSDEERLGPGPGESFFSRTTSTVFASTVFFATVFGDYRPDSSLRPWVWGAALAAGGTVGYLRFASGVHYPSDVLVGAAVGTAAGYLVPRMHRVEEGALSLAPGVGPGGEVTLSGSIRF